MLDITHQHGLIQCLQHNLHLSGKYVRGQITPLSWSHATATVHHRNQCWAIFAQMNQNKNLKYICGIIKKTSLNKTTNSKYIAARWSLYRGGIIIWCCHFQLNIWRLWKLRVLITASPPVDATNLAMSRADGFSWSILYNLLRIDHFAP